MLGKILFILYIIFLVYFLFLSDWYGREGVMDEYHYNLVLFKEIKRFIKYRHQLGTFAVFSNLFGNILIFMPVGYFSAMAGKFFPQSKRNTSSALHRSQTAHPDILQESGLREYIQIRSQKKGSRRLWKFSHISVQTH